MNKKIAIIVKNYSSKIRDVGDINGLALYKNLNKLGVSVDLVYLNGESDDSESIISHKTALFRRYDVIYASSPKRYYALMCIFFSILHSKPLYISIFDSTLEPFTASTARRVFFKYIYQLGLVSLISSSRFQRKYIKKNLNIKTPLIYPCLLTFGYNNLIKKSGKVLLFAGSTNNQKRGIDTIIRALHIVKKKYPSVKLRILNKFSKDERWSEITENLISEYKLDRSIDQIGYVNDMAQEYIKARVYILPFNTTKYIPPLPFTMIEAMSFGVPVISSDIAELHELLKKDQLINPGDHEDLSKKVIDIFETKRAVQIDDSFFPERVARRFLKVVRIKEDKMNE